MSMQNSDNMATQGQPQMPIPDQGAPMNGDMQGQDGMMDSEMPMPNGNDSSGSEFDTNFDAGVQADEDEDPKKYIQQLTGKLSQELNKYNNENGGDDELSKYVGKMIVKASAKSLDSAGKKDLIKSIKQTESSDDEDMDLSDDESMGDDMQDSGNGMNNGMDNGEMPQENPDEMQPMNEMVYNKGKLKRLFEMISSETFDKDYNDDSKRENKPKKKKVNKFNPIKGKKF